MPRRFSEAWTRALKEIRTSDWPELRYVPMLPFLPPPVPKVVREAFASAGRRLSVPAGQHFFG